MSGWAVDRRVMVVASLDVLVVRGGPDPERPVSLQSGERVAVALRAAGPRVAEADAGPAGGAIGLDAVDGWVAEHAGGVVFPVLHGRWGEGGGMQAELERLGARYVGTRSAAAARCIDKAVTKAALREAGIDTPESVELTEPGPSPIDGPVAVKPIDQGSSIGVHVCRSADAVPAAIDAAFAVSERVLIERVIEGPELTVGVLEDDAGVGNALPLVRIEPAVAVDGVYDYAAKYSRDDTRYLIGAEAAGLSAATAEAAVAMAEATHRVMGCRHVSRVDVMVDGAGRPWVIEVN
ncbi:MAG: ATP-grasp domain-containing protein, partial [Planctomycetota bacterium]